MTGNTSHATARPLTVAEFEELPDDEGCRVELVRGTVVRESRPSAYHGVLTARLFRVVDAHVRS